MYSITREKRKHSSSVESSDDSSNDSPAKSDPRLEKRKKISDPALTNQEKRKHSSSAESSDDSSNKSSAKSDPRLEKRKKISDPALNSHNDSIESRDQEDLNLHQGVPAITSESMDNENKDRIFEDQINNLSNRFDDSSLSYNTGEQYTKYSSPDINSPNQSQKSLLYPDVVNKELNIDYIIDKDYSYEVFRKLMVRFYYLRDYETPQAEIAITADYYRELNDKFQEKFQDKNDPYAKSVKNLCLINYLFADINHLQQIVEKNPTLNNYDKLLTTYTTLIKQLHDYRDNLVLLKYLIISPVSPHILIDHDQDVLDTIKKVQGEKQYAEEKANYSNAQTPENSFKPEM